MPEPTDTRKRLKRGPYRIAIAGEWALQDLYVYPRAFGQLYSFMYAITTGRLVPLLHELDGDETEDPLFDHPWIGGYSAVNFFGYVTSRVSRSHRPRLLSMQYASPGWIEFAVVLSAASAVSLLVARFTKVGHQLNDLYNAIYKGLHERKMMQMDVRERALSLEREELKFLEESTNKMAEMMGFENVAALNRLTGNPIATLKALLAVYRRVKALGKYELSGKAKLP